MNRTQVLEQIGPLTDLNRRKITHSGKGKVLMEPDAIIIKPGERQRGLTVPFKSQAEGALNGFIGIPAALKGKVKSDTYVRVVDDLLNRAGEFEVVTQGDQIVSFNEPGNVTSLPVEKTLRTIESSIRGDIDFHRVHNDKFAISLEVVGTNEEAVARGDLIRGGAMVRFSPIGITRPSVEAYVLRLECTNGATSTHTLREFILTGGGDGGGDNIWNWLRDSTRDAYKQVRQIAGDYRRLREEAVSDRDRAMVLANLLKEARLSQEEVAAIQARALEAPPQNAYDVMNLMTWASSHVVTEPSRIFRAQKAARSFASEAEHARTCPVCRSKR